MQNMPPETRAAPGRSSLGRVDDGALAVQQGHRADDGDAGEDQVDLPAPVDQHRRRSATDRRV
jgi:hypothetical protein